MLKNLVLSLLCLGYLCPISQAQESVSISEEVQKNVQSRIDNGINPGIVIGLIEGDDIHFSSFGIKSVVSKEPVDENSVFEIGSISKTFTGILLADMALKNKLSLDDPLQKYLPDSVTAPTRNGEEIHLVQMANHTSGLPRMPSNFTPADPANPYVDYSEEQLYAFLDGYDLQRDIGTEYEYSNYAMGLLGHILARKYGKSYEEMMVEVIAQPLGMKNTRVVLTPEMKENLAIGHSNGVEVSNWDIPTLAGAGAIRSTATDMLSYIAANMGKVKTDLYPAMQLSHKNTRKEGTSPIVGLAWHIMVMDDEREIAWHNGGTGGYRTFAGFIKGGNKGVVVLSNADASVDDIGIHLLDPTSPLREIKPSIAVEIREVMDKEGIEAGKTFYWKLKKEQADNYDFSESELNSLGYYYLGENEIDKAIAVLEINVAAYPEAFNTYDSLGEAFMANEENEKAISNYKKSVKLNPANQGGIDVLKKLGVDTEELVKEVEVDTEILESYVGKYELMPGFILTVTRDGSQLSAQATGQPSFYIYPRTENIFYLKVVAAQLTFNKNADGQVESVTLLQGGQELVGPKLGE